MMRVISSCIILSLTASFLQTKYLVSHDLVQLVPIGPSRISSTGTANAAARHDDMRRPSTLLTVPFYVYEELVWHNLTYGAQTLEMQLAKAPLKQSEDFWFMKASLLHPLRTRNPQQAKLFVVPTLMNFVSDGIALALQDPLFKTCYNGLCNEQLLRHTEAFLSNSTYYQRSKGSDHIMVLSNWYSSQRPDLFQGSHILSNLNLIHFEDQKINNPHRSSFPSTYVGIPCNVSDTKTTDFAFVGSLWEDAPKKKRKRFQTRRNVCQWLLRSPYKTSTHVCGSGVEQCPVLAQAKYGFHIRGDTYGANRLLDTLLSGTVPIFTDWNEQHSILPDWIDWELLSVRVNVTNMHHFLKGLRNILGQTDYETKRQHLLDNRDLLDWRTGIAFDVYMFMFQRELLPNTVPRRINNPYSFSALTI